MSAATHSRSRVVPLERRAREDDQPGAGDQRARRARARPSQRRVAARGEREQRRVQQPHGEVAQPPQHAVVAERARRGERDHQHRGHRREHHEPRQQQLRVDGARQPRVARPRPPDDREHHEPAAQLRERRVLGQERRDLRQREHEHEVEEQLQRRDASPRAGRPARAPAAPARGSVVLIRWRVYVSARSRAAQELALGGVRP